MAVANVFSSSREGMKTYQLILSALLDRLYLEKLMPLLAWPHAVTRV